MSTYLELCQDVTRESGTVPTIGQPETTAGQTGRLLRITKWVTKAYDDIQRAHQTWRWMHADFSGSTIAGVQQYDSTAMSISSRFSHWVRYDEDGRNLFSIYKTSEGQSDENYLTYVDWTRFRRELLTGSAATQQDRPAYVTIDTENKLRLWPIPDAAYTLRGVYYKANQTISADEDTPEMPSDYHNAITWRALMLLGAFDEAFEQMGFWSSEYARIMGDLRLHQLPRMRIQSTLA